MTGDHYTKPAHKLLGAQPRVALIHDWLTGMRGGEMVLEAIAESFPEAPIFTLLHLKGTVSPALEAHEIRTSFLQNWPFFKKHYRHFLPFFPSAIEDFDLAEYDLIISTSHCVAKGIIPAPNAHHICYCHTPMRYAWDQEHAYFPKRRGLIARLRNGALTGLRAWDAASAPRVDDFLANSHFVARRIERYYGRHAEVLAPPVDVDFFTGDAADKDVDALDRSQGDYALMVSALAPYKKVEVAIDACGRLGMPLKIVGTGPEEIRLRQSATDTTEFLGHVDRHTLRTLYQQARFFLQPGIEDFGIAAVESLASGTPVVALGQGGVCDIVRHQQHGFLYDPVAVGLVTESRALEAAIDKSLKISFNYSHLEKRAKSFSRQRFTDQLLQIVSRRSEAGDP